MMRPRNATHSTCALARTRKPARVPSWLRRSSGLRPTRSLSLPNRGPLKSEQREYTEMSNPTWVAEAPSVCA
jgi:hypothetical protein